MLTMLVLNILLPTADTVTDIILVIKLYRGADRGGHWENHLIMATAMLLPFLLNYVVCLITFFRKETYRRFTFIFALLNIYPQFKAFKIIHLLWTDEENGKKKKKEFDQDIGLHETFLESVPSVFIMTVIWITTFSGPPGTGRENFTVRKIIGLGWFFFLSYSFSIISASLGLSKSLKNGVCRIMKDGGTLDGLLSGRFLLAFLSSLTCLVARGLCLGITTAVILD